MEDKGRSLKLRSVDLAKVKRMLLKFRKFHNSRQLRLGANGSGVGSEDGMQIREAS